MGQLKGKKILSFDCYIIKDTRLLQKYVHFYNVSITKDMIINHTFELEN